MGRRGDGVEARESSIRIQFVHDGQTFRERLIVDGKTLPPTPQNLRTAGLVAREIRKRLDRGTFDYAEFFPHSPNARAQAPRSFGEVADQWLTSKGQLEPATRDQYANAVAMWKRLLNEDTAIDGVRYQDLASCIGGHPWASAKSANNYLIVLRGIFGFEFSGKRAGDNPMTGILNLSVVKKLPDPLTADERDLILADLAQRRDPRVWAYFAWMFYTGMRPEETIALQWGDIDFNARIVRVQRVRTFRGSERDGSKTHAERDVDLVSPALEALAVMKPWTFLKRDDAGRPVDLFENPLTGRAWHDERAQRDTYWSPTLKRLGIRQRRAYATRHTYATTALMAGVNPAYIARQLGHTSTKMLFEVYARWIDGADKGQERRALEAALSRNSSQNSSQGGVNG